MRRRIEKWMRRREKDREMDEEKGDGGRGLDEDKVQE